MPKLPSLLDNGRQTAQAGGGIVGYRADFGGGEAAGRALVNVGGMVGNIEERYRHEQERQAQLGAEDALNQFRAEAINLEAGDSGYNNLRGEQAVKRPVYQEYTGKLNDAYNRIAGTLTDERAKQMFKQRADVFGLQFKEGILRHVKQQNDVYAEQTFKGTLDVEQQNAAINWDSADPKLNENGQQNNLGLSLMRTRNAVNMMAERGGWSPEYRDAVMAKSIGGIHQVVIDQAIAAGRTDFANEYLKANKDGLTDDQLKAVEGKLKPATDWQIGKQLATEAWALQQAGKKPKEVEAMLIEKAKNPQEHAAAQSMLRQLEQAAKVQDAEQKGALLEKFSGAPTRANMNAIIGSSDFLSMSRDVRGHLAEYMRNQVEQTETHGRVLRNEKFQSPEAFAQFMDTLEDPNFSTMSRAQLFALQPEIGPQLTAKLLSEHQNINNGVKRFQIDKDLINSGLPEKLTRATSETEKKQRNAFLGIVESNLQEWKNSHPGKTPDLNEQKAIVASANKDYTALGAGWFGGDKTVPAYQVTEKMKAVPKDFVDGLRAAAQKKGKTLTNDQVLKAWDLQKGR